MLREIGLWVDEKRKAVNSMPWRKRSIIKFVKSGEKAATKPTSDRSEETFLKTARDWKLQVDLPESRTIVPVEIAVISQRPDIISSQSMKQLFIIELTV